MAAAVHISATFATALHKGPVPGLGGRASTTELPQFSGNSLVARKTFRHTVARGNVVLKQRPASRFVVLGGGVKSPWDIGRFIKTWQFFNEPFNLGKILENVLSKFSSQGEQPSAAKEVMEVVLVCGATGGVGKRVVEVLRSKGIPVRALVRNLDKARSLLGPDVEVVAADVTQKATLLPEYFKGVKAVINAISVTVGPKEGDTDRAKYFQGIKFFDPEIKGDSPETVEVKGLNNLLEAVKDNVGVEGGVTLFSVGADGPVGPAWGSLDDVVMGGASESSLLFSMTGGENGEPVGLYKGVASTANSGGFASIRTKNFSPQLNLSAYAGLKLRIKGNGRRFKIIIRNTAEWDAAGYTLGFDTVYNEWETIYVPFDKLVPVFRARSVKDAPPFDPSNVFSLQLLYSKFEYDQKLNPTFEPGPFEIAIASIKSYLKEPITPRFIHVSSAGVTRPDRPGLDLSKQPPAVRLNKELGYILTYKLQGEDAIRESGIPYAIVRPCALTEEPAGAELIFDQGDNITGKVAREEIARILVAALSSPAVTNTTFEVKSTVPFSEPFTIDSVNPPPERDYVDFFESLKTGVTGKEVPEVIPA